MRLVTPACYSVVHGLTPWHVRNAILAGRLPPGVPLRGNPTVPLAGEGARRLAPVAPRVVLAPKGDHR